MRRSRVRLSVPRGGPRRRCTGKPRPAEGFMRSKVGRLTCWITFSRRSAPGVGRAVPTQHRRIAMPARAPARQLSVTNDRGSLESRRPAAVAGGQIRTAHRHSPSRCLRSSRRSFGRRFGRCMLSRHCPRSSTALLEAAPARRRRVARRLGPRACGGRFRCCGYSHQR